MSDLLLTRQQSQAQARSLTTMASDIRVSCDSSCVALLNLDVLVFYFKTFVLCTVVTKTDIKLDQK